MRLDKNLVLIGPYRHRSYLESERLVDGLLEAGYSMDGVVAVGDRVAIGCCSLLRRHGYAIGSDVRVIGMDDSLHSRIASPSLSTVQRYPKLLAWDASLCLLAMVEGEREAVRQIIIPHKIIERESSLGVAVGHEGGQGELLGGEMAWGGALLAAPAPTARWKGCESIKARLPHPCDGVLALGDGTVVVVGPAEVTYSSARTSSVAARKASISLRVPMVTRNQSVMRGAA